MSTSTRRATAKPQNHFQPTGPKHWIAEELHNIKDETTETQEDSYTEDNRFQIQYEEYQENYNPIDNTYYENPQHQEKANFHSITDPQNPT